MGGLFLNTLKIGGRGGVIPQSLALAGTESETSSTHTPVAKCIQLGMGMVAFLRGRAPPGCFFSLALRSLHDLGGSHCGKTIPHDYLMTQNLHIFLPCTMAVRGL